MTISSQQPMLSDAIIDQLVDDYMSYDSEQRSDVRRYAQLPVRLCYVDDGRVVEYGVTRDISRRGIGIITKRPVEPGCRVHVQLNTLAGDIVDAPTKIVHCTAFGPFFHIGGYFIDLNQTTVEAD